MKTRKFKTPMTKSIAAVSTLIFSTAALPSLQASTAPKLQSESVDQVTEQTIKDMDPASAPYTDSNHFKNGLAEGKIEAAFLFNEKLNNFTLDSEVTYSQATLTGEVKSEEHKRLAEQLALEITDINRVDNKIVVAQKDDSENEPANGFFKSVQDAGITASIKFKYLVHDQLSAAAIHVDTVDQVVTLSGEVETSNQKSLAENIARDADDVETVNNLIVVPAT